MSESVKQQKLDEWVLRVAVEDMKTLLIDFLASCVVVDLPYYSWDGCFRLNDNSGGGEQLDTNTMLARIGRAIAANLLDVQDELIKKPDVLDDRESMIAIGAVAWSRLATCGNSCLDQWGFRVGGWVEDPAPRSNRRL